MTIPTDPADPTGSDKKTTRRTSYDELIGSAGSEVELPALISARGYVALAAGSMVVSAICALAFRKRDLANFIGLWAPSLLVLGIYSKLLTMERTLEHRSHLH